MLSSFWYICCHWTSSSWSYPIRWQIPWVTITCQKRTNNFTSLITYLVISSGWSKIFKRGNQGPKIFKKWGTVCDRSTKKTWNGQLHASKIEIKCFKTKPIEGPSLGTIGKKMENVALIHTTTGFPFRLKCTAIYIYINVQTYIYDWVG